MPLKALAAGVSIGLMSQHFPAALATDGNAPLPQQLEDYGDSVLLTDIQGSEDHLGDMDFKVRDDMFGSNNSNVIHKQACMLGWCCTNTAWSMAALHHCSLISTFS